MKLLALAHRYGGDPAQLPIAEDVETSLSLFLAPHAVVVAPWIRMCRVVPETPASRVIGLRGTCAFIERVDALVVASAPSPGVDQEIEAAIRYGKKVFYLPTHTDDPAVVLARHDALYAILAWAQGDA